ncbi:hypothetical protein [Fictibacillus fluitans]|uniref:Uncharacterized protein n=1 Tax=Fictibacillus fluitans TaxID=3058422 RepID=A0ABT8HVS9_9BACL|nr:hypothetical protein [Fictibacillus sp. NE201]MDN4524883.1 hypothetical protein [Fictibacillus sp. NE201]
MAMMERVSSFESINEIDKELEKSNKETNELLTKVLDFMNLQSIGDFSINKVTEDNKVKKERA